MFGLRDYAPGVRVIYGCEKQGRRPAPHAGLVYPSASGETYRYWVPKFWVVDSVLPDGQVIVRTRRGKVRRVAEADASLRPASWWERLRYASRFPSAGDHPTSVTPKIRTF